MWYRFLIFDLKRTLFSKVTLGLIMVFLLISYAGIYAGDMRYSEIQLMSKNNVDVVQITNTGSFLERARNIVDRTFDYHQSGDIRWGFIFVFSKLVDYWPVGAFFLLLVYGYHFLTREKITGVFHALQASPLRLLEYYFAKVLSGALYWGIFLYFYAVLLIGLCTLLGGISRSLFHGIFSGMFVLWLYMCLLWLVYLLVSFSLKNYQKTLHVLLLLVLIFAFFIPEGVRLISHNTYPEAPKAPYLTNFPWVMTPENGQTPTIEEAAAIEKSLNSLREYQQKIVTYFANGISLENRLSYMSPQLVVEKATQTFFRPELLNVQELLKGRWQRPRFRTVLRAETPAIIYLLLLNCCCFTATYLVLKYREESLSRLFTAN